MVVVVCCWCDLGLLVRDIRAIVYIGFRAKVEVSRRALPPSEETLIFTGFTHHSSAEGFQRSFEILQTRINYVLMNMLTGRCSLTLIPCQSRFPQADWLLVAQPTRMGICVSVEDNQK